MEASPPEVRNIYGETCVTNPCSLTKAYVLYWQPRQQIYSGSALRAVLAQKVSLNSNIYTGNKQWLHSPEHLIIKLLNSGSYQEFLITQSVEDRDTPIKQSSQKLNFPLDSVCFTLEKMWLKHCIRVSL